MELGFIKMVADLCQEKPSVCLTPQLRNGFPKTGVCARPSRPPFCEGEVLVIRPHLLGESAQEYSLLNLREDEGQEEVLEIKMKKRRSVKLMKKGQGSQRERSTHACDMVMTMGWNETQTQTS